MFTLTDPIPILLPILIWLSIGMNINVIGHFIRIGIGQCECIVSKGPQKEVSEICNLGCGCKSLCKDDTKWNIQYVHHNFRMYIMNFPGLLSSIYLQVDLGERGMPLFYWIVLDLLHSCEHLSTFK